MSIKLTRYMNLASELSNNAWYFKTEIERKIEGKDFDGINILASSCIIFSVFALEARFNTIISKRKKSIGQTITHDSKFKNKLDYFDDILKLEKLDFNSAHYTEIRNAEAIRNTLAHSKPYKIFKELNGSSIDSLRLNQNEKEKYENYCNYLNALKMYESCDFLWSKLKEYYKIKYHEETRHQDFHC